MSKPSSTKLCLIARLITVKVYYIQTRGIALVPIGFIADGEIGSKGSGSSVSSLSFRPFVSSFPPPALDSR
jgi:hypothetical protein